MLLPSVIPFIKCVEQQHPQPNDVLKFEVTPEACDFLSSLRGDISVLCVGGKYRSGKSFLLNQLNAGLSSPSGGGSGGGGFGVGNTVNRCTMGIWLSTQLITVTDEHQQISQCLVLDCEGLSAVNASEDRDLKLFALALLLSSLFIFNAKAVVDQESLTVLAKVIDIANMIDIDEDTAASQNNNTNKKRKLIHDGGDIENTSGGVVKDDIKIEKPELKKNCFPHFLWLLRDFSLKLTRAEDNTEMTTTEYMNSFLAVGGAEGSSSSSAVAAGKKNQHTTDDKMKIALRTLLPHRECFALPVPAHEESVLQNLAQASTQQMRKVFVEQLQHLKQHIFTHMPPKKTLDGHNITGSMLARFALDLVSAFNSDTLPVINNSWSMMSDLQCQRALDQAALEWFSLKQQHASKILSVSQWNAAMLEARQKAEKKYNSLALGVEKEKYKDRLLASVSAQEVLYWEQNKQAWEKKTAQKLEVWEKQQQQHGKEVGDDDNKNKDKEEDEVATWKEKLYLWSDQQMTEMMGVEEGVLSNATAAADKTKKTEISEILQTLMLNQCWNKWHSQYQRHRQEHYKRLQWEQKFESEQVEGLRLREENRTLTEQATAGQLKEERANLKQSEMQEKCDGLVQEQKQRQERIEQLEASLLLTTEHNTQKAFVANQRILELESDWDSVIKEKIQLQEGFREKEGALAQIQAKMQQFEEDRETLQKVQEALTTSEQRRREVEEDLEVARKDFQTKLETTLQALETRCNNIKREGKREQEEERKQSLVLQKKYQECHEKNLLLEGIQKEWREQQQWQQQQEVLNRKRCQDSDDKLERLQAQQETVRQEQSLKVKLLEEKINSLADQRLQERIAATKDCQEALTKVALLEQKQVVDRKKLSEWEKSEDEHQRLRQQNQNLQAEVSKSAAERNVIQRNYSKLCEEESSLRSKLKELEVKFTEVQYKYNLARLQKE